MSWLIKANLLGLFIIGTFLASDILKKPLAKTLWAEEYKELMYNCDHSMRDHLIAKRAVEIEPNDSTIKNLQSSEVSLIVCHDYDKLRKKLKDWDFNDNDLQILGLEALEEKAYDLEKFVEIHEIRY